MERVLLRISLAFTAVAASTLAWGLFRSRQLTGQWFGYPLPSSVAIAIAGGLLFVVFGGLFSIAAAVSYIFDRPRVREVLYSRVASEGSAVADVGKGLLRVHHLFNVLAGAGVLIVVAWAALTDLLVAAILAAAGLVGLVVYFVFRERSG